MAKEIVKRSYRRTTDLLQLKSVYSQTLWFSILESSFMSFVKQPDFLSCFFREGIHEILCLQTWDRQTEDSHTFKKKTKKNYYSGHGCHQCITIHM